MAERIYLHVGTPQSETAFLHTVLWKNADRLRERNVLVPGRMSQHFAAAKSITARRTLARPTGSGDIHAAWPRLARQIESWPGTAVISHELLAPATRDQAARALALLSGKVHVVITARALHLQPAAAWRDQVKGGLRTPFHVFLDRIRESKAKGRRFWRVQDHVTIADNWRGPLAPERVQVVTVPPTGSPPGLLWRRFATALGLDPDELDTSGGAGESNAMRHHHSSSPGLVETELLRRIHARRDERFTDPGRHLWTRQLLANDILGRRTGTPIRLPDHVQPWLAARSGEMLTRVRGAGYAVVGDLDDLRWRPPPLQARLVDTVTDREIEDATAWTILRLQEALIFRQPTNALPTVGPGDGIDGVLELLEHIRAADTATTPRPASETLVSNIERLRRALPTLHGR